MSYKILLALFFDFVVVQFSFAENGRNSLPAEKLFNEYGSNNETMSIRELEDLMRTVGIKYFQNEDHVKPVNFNVSIFFYILFLKCFNVTELCEIFGFDKKKTINMKKFTNLILMSMILMSITSDCTIDHDDIVEKCESSIKTRE
jgi:hypothetical protein